MTRLHFLTWVLQQTFFTKEAKMKKAMFLLVLVVFICGTHPLWAADAQRVRFATHQLGSSWYIYGGLISEVLNKVLPKGESVDVLPYAAALGNPKLVAKGEAEMGLAFPLTAKWAFEGRVAYEKKLTNLRGLVGALDQYFWAVISPKKSNISSLADIHKKKLPVNLVTLPKGSLAELQMRDVLRCYGTSYKDIESYGGKVTHTSFGVMKKSIMEGQADLAVTNLTIGHPAFTEMAISTDVVFLGISDDVFEKLSKEGYVKALLPANSFRGQDKAVPTFGNSTCIIANDKMSNDLAYAITKGICEGRESLIKGHAGLKTFNPAVSWRPENLGVPLHPGAARYYKEVGWMK
jgi:TRAP transporter TAXI family solute receptor